MLFDRYEQAGLLFNKNFKEATEAAVAYRGELVLVEGEVGDAQGRRKPPVAVLGQAVMLAEGEQLKLAAGFLEDAAEVQIFVDKYQDDFASDTKLFFFVVNIPAPVQCAAAAASAVLIPLTEGMVWNELIDLVALEKSDFKGQSSAEKVETLYTALRGYTPKFPTVTLAEAVSGTVEVKREVRGAI
ncbi:hypothetical protein [Plasticicumulans acidivorans]|uniref:Uncharacterized protein n=1 Tax=Plasticicumulans acidivorans TaxID=886464 RepID=A0A317MSM6_9GAMM|nr:hypothetical protein [Plasticicumulans acidivorans]PWV60144.1 hypothetical protein C7443_10873 [Plasticicumulans acidivorans]